MRNLRKEKTILEENIKKWKLNLNNLTVLTEAASRNYIFAPLIATLAGAQVYAFTKDSSYGSAEKTAKETLFLAKDFGVLEKIEIFKNYLPPSAISQADIVTNLGFLRPIDEKFISYLKKTAVISLMWETWEFRESDLDLKACWQKDIPVLGTNENHPKLKILDYLGKLILKKIYEKGIKELHGLKTILLAEDKFGPYIERDLKKAGAKVFRDIGHLEDTKIIIVAYHKNRKEVISKKGILTAEEIKRLAPDVLVLQLTGTGIISRKQLDEKNIRYTPEETPEPYFMSWTLADLGINPLVELHTAGLKVGEVLARARLRGLSRKEAEREALKNSPSQDFSKEQKIKYAAQKRQK